jgi:hypothetical protein
MCLSLPKMYKVYILRLENVFFLAFLHFGLCSFGLGSLCCIFAIYCHI